MSHRFILAERWNGSSWTHADMWIPVAAQAEMACMGAFIEHSVIRCVLVSFGWDSHQVAEAVRAVGPRSCIPSTDLGQTDNPASAEGLRMFIAAMLREEFSKEQVGMMVKDNPGQLLGLC
jgi:hypothetical protein